MTLTANDLWFAIHNPKVAKLLATFINQLETPFQAQPAPPHICVLINSRAEERVSGTWVMGAPTNLTDIRVQIVHPPSDEVWWEQQFLLRRGEDQLYTQGKSAIHAINTADVMAIVPHTLEHLREHGRLPHAVAAFAHASTLPRPPKQHKHKKK